MFFNDPEFGLCMLICPAWKMWVNLVYPPWRQVCNFWCFSRSSRETKWGKNCSFLQAGDFDWFWLTNMTNGSMVSLQFPYCEMEAFFPPNLVWAGCNRDHISPSAGAFRPSKAGKDEKHVLLFFAPVWVHFSSGVSLKNYGKTPKSNGLSSFSY